MRLFGIPSLQSSFSNSYAEQLLKASTHSAAHCVLDLNLLIGRQNQNKSHKSKIFIKNCFNYIAVTVVLLRINTGISKCPVHNSYCFLTLERIYEFYQLFLFTQQ